MADPQNRNRPVRERAGRAVVRNDGRERPLRPKRQPFGSTTIVTSGVMPERTLIATL